jgi:hypothetical protein
MRLSIKPPRLAVLLAAAAATLGVSAGSAMAARGNSITTVVSGSLALTPPFFGTATGSYTTTGVVDFGTVTAQFVLPIQPPKATQIETFRTLTSTEGNGTLQLHCSEIARPGVQNNTHTTTGSCAVQSASGVYSGFARSARLTGIIDTNASTLTDTIVF